MRFLELIKLKGRGCPEPSLISGVSWKSAPAEDLYVYSSASVSIKGDDYPQGQGLEFSVVIIPFLEMFAFRGRGESFFVFSDDSSLRLGHLNKEGALNWQVLSRLYRSELKKALIDELNCIYVAFTRPKYELYGFIPEKASGTRIRRFCFSLHPPRVEGVREGRLPAHRQGRWLAPSRPLAMTRPHSPTGYLY